MQDHARRPDAGLTLVELLVTIVLAGLVSASAFAFFNGQRTIFALHSKLLNVQQNLWSAMDAVTRSLRSAGGGMLGCVRPDSDAAGPDTGDPGPGGAVTPATGLRVFREGVGVMRIPPLWIQNGAGGAPDTLTVAFGDNSSGTFADAALALDVQTDQSIAPIRTLPGETVRFRTGEFILLVERSQANGDRGCSLFQLTGINAGTNTLQHDAASSPWNPAANLLGHVPFTYVGGSATATGGIRNFGELNWIRFAIDSSGAPARAPRLTMNRLDGNLGPQVLAEGIEDMQIAYACDLAPAGAADGILTEGTDAASRLADEWTYNEAGDVPQAGCIRPNAIRITLIGRSRSEDALLTGSPDNAKPAAEDGVRGPPDRYRHRVATVSINPRN